jgi:hypothetical protein
VDCLHAHRGITLTALPRGQWFCSPACRGVHRALQRVCARGQVKGDGMAAGYTWQLLKSAQTALGGGAGGGERGGAGGGKQRARLEQRPETPLGHALAVLQVGAFVCSYRATPSLTLSLSRTLSLSPPLPHLSAAFSVRGKVQSRRSEATATWGARRSSNSPWNPPGSRCRPGIAWVCLASRLPDWATVF